MQTLTLEALTQAVDGQGVAVRAVTRLLPAGGAGDKVFPPTYSVAEKARTRYAMETRRVAGKDVPTVLLDSVASQANRMELALLRAWERGELGFPMAWVDFSTVPGLEDLGRISALQAPHRIADALFRDSLLEGQPFRLSGPGRAFTEARPDVATAVYRYCPTGLVFGVWDSTGPKGGRGAKYARALCSEIVGFGAALGAKTASRLDPAGIERNAGTIYEAADASEDWTTSDKEAAVDDKGNPKLFGRTKKDKGTPSSINHGNVAPSIDEQAGGVTIDHAVQTTVLSLPALRRLRFPFDVAGTPVPQAQRPQVETAVRTVLAALGLAAIAEHREEGYDLRSRCLLVPDVEHPATIELVRRDGTTASFALSGADAARLLAAAHARAAEVGFGWSREPLALTPAPKLVALIRKSRELADAEPSVEN